MRSLNKTLTTVTLGSSLALALPSNSYAQDFTSPLSPLNPMYLTSPLNPSNSPFSAVRSASASKSNELIHPGVVCSVLFFAGVIGFLYQELRQKNRKEERSQYDF